MTSVASPTPLPTSEPAWDIARLFPDQGVWSEDDYLALSGNRLVEFSDGFVEVLPMPSFAHQMIASVLYNLLREHVDRQKMGVVLFAPFPVRVRSSKYREPDVVYLSSRQLSHNPDQYSEGADLVVEVVSANDPTRDIETKRREYSLAGIPEYWIVDPRDQSITVLTLKDECYVEHGVFPVGQVATSVLLAGFQADVSAVFNAARVLNQPPS